MKVGGARLTDSRPEKKVPLLQNPRIRPIWLSHFFL